MRIVSGLIGIAVGTLLVWKTYPIVSFTGKFDWAERIFSGGFGGTYFFIKLLGLALVVLSILHMVGLLDVLLLPFGNVFGGLAPQ